MSKTEIATVEPEAGTIELSPVSGNQLLKSDTGLIPANMGQVVELAQLMAKAGPAVPKAFRGAPGLCAAVIFQALHWRANPFSLASLAYVVNDKVAYEAKVIHAAIEAFAPLKAPLHGVYAGEGQTRKLTVYGFVRGAEERKDYETPILSEITPKNSPLWKSDPDQQLWYYATRGWARRWAPGVILGILTPEEAENPDFDNGEPRKERATIGAVTQRLTDAAKKPAEELAATDAEFEEAAATKKAEEAQAEVTAVVDGLASAVDEPEPATADAAPAEKKAEPEPAKDPEPEPQETTQEAAPTEANENAIWPTPAEAKTELERVIAHIKTTDDVNAYLDGWRDMVKESFIMAAAMDTISDGDRMAQRRRLEIAKEAAAKPTKKRANV